MTKTYQIITKSYQKSTILDSKKVQFLTKKRTNSAQICKQNLSKHIQNHTQRIQNCTKILIVLEFSIMKLRKFLDGGNYVKLAINNKLQFLGR